MRTNRLTKIGVALLALFLIGCTTGLKKEVVDSIKTIGLINTFPDLPHYTIHGTTVFTNEYSKIGVDRIKKDLTENVVSKLSANGFDVSVLHDSDKPESAPYDLVIQMRPAYHEVKDRHAYGVLEASIFGLRAKPLVYVYLALDMYRGGKRQASSEALEGGFFYFGDDMPPKWDDLGEGQKNEILNLFSWYIESAVSKNLRAAGLIRVE